MLTYAVSEKISRNGLFYLAPSYSYCSPHHINYQTQKTSECDQVIPNTDTHCRPTHSTVRKSHRTLTVSRHQEDTWKTVSSLFPIKIIAKLEGHKVLNIKRGSNIEPPQTMGATINQQQHNHRLTTPKPGGGGLKCILLIPNLVIKSLDSAVKFSLHGGFLTIAMYCFRETI